MSVKFRQMAHFEQVHSIEGSLFRKYQKIAAGIQFGKDDIAEAMAKLLSMIALDMDIDAKIEALISRSRSSENFNEDAINTIGDLSTVPTVILDRIQSLTESPESVEAVLRDIRVEQFFKVLPLLMKTVSRSGSFSDSQQAEVVVMTRVFMNALESAGKKVFVLSDDLAWALRETELRRFPADDLRLPYRTIYVEIPDGYKVYNRDTKWHDAIGCYVSEAEIEGARRWRILIVGGSKPGAIEMDDAIFFFSVDLNEGATVEDCLKRCRVEHRERNGLLHAGVPVELFDEVEDENEKLFRLLMNVVLYVTNQDADTMLSDASSEYRDLRDRMLKAQGGKRDRIKARMRQMGSRARVVLGGRLVIDRHENVNQEGAQDVVDGSGKSWSWKVRTLVRGHWRSQPCGPGGKNRRPKWIAPHWAGPQKAQVTSKIAEVR